MLEKLLNRMHMAERTRTYVWSRSYSGMAVPTMVFKKLSSCVPKPAECDLEKGRQDMAASTPPSSFASQLSLLLSQVPLPGLPHVCCDTVVFSASRWAAQDSGYKAEMHPSVGMASSSHADQFSPPIPLDGPGPADWPA